MAPDSTTGRVDGTTYPTDAAPDGSVSLGERPQRRRDRVRTWLLRVLLDASVQLLRPTRDDVIVVRGPTPTSELRHGLNEALRNSGHLGVVLFMPDDVRVHAEPGKLKREDRGYRETKTYGADGKDQRDTDTSNRDARGVHTGLPGFDRPMTPNPMSDRGDNDPLAPSKRGMDSETCS